MKPADQCPDFLSLEQHQLLSGKRSLKGLMDRLEETKHKTMLQVRFNKYLKFSRVSVKKAGIYNTDPLLIEFTEKITINRTFPNYL